MKFYKAVAAAVAAVVFSSLLVAGPAQAADCTDWVFLGARGSGEPANAPASGVGTKLDGLYQGIKQRVEEEGLTMRAEGVVYPAVPISGSLSAIATAITALLPIGKKYRKSVAEGAAAFQQQISTNRTSCPNSRIILAGYSQGGEALNIASYKLSPSDKASIGGVFIYGDPWFNADDKIANVGTYDPYHHGLFNRRGIWEQDGFNNAVSICNGADPVCNSTAIGPDGKPYRDVQYLRDYYLAHGITDPFEPHTTGIQNVQRDTALLAQQMGLTGIDTPELGTADVYSFVINAGDFIADIGQAVDSVIAAADAISTKNANAIFQLDIVMNPESTDERGNTVAGYGTGYASKEGYKELFLSVRSDVTQYTLVTSTDTDVRNMVTNGIHWLRGWQEPKTLVFVSSTAPKSEYMPELISDAKEAGVSVFQADLKTGILDPVGRQSRQSAPSAQDTSSAESDMSALTEATGGAVFTGSDAITRAGAAAAARPQVTMSRSPGATAGQPVQFSAVDSYPDLQNTATEYVWNFGTGTPVGQWDLTTATPEVQTVFPAAGTYDVQMKAVTAEGVGHILSEKVTVVASTGAVPSRVTALTAVPTADSVSLSWPSDPTATIYQVLDANGVIVDSFGASANVGPVLTWVQRQLPLGTKSTFSVRAGNAFGMSPLGTAVSTTTAPAAVLSADSRVTSSGYESVAGDVWVKGSFTCASGDRYSGSIIATGNVSVGTDCAVAGNVIAGGSVTLARYSAVEGDVRSVGVVTAQDTTARVDGDANSRTTASIANSSTSFATLVGGTLTVNDTTVVTPAAPTKPSVVVPTSTMSWKDFRAQIVTALKSANPAFVDTMSACALPFIDASAPVRITTKTVVNATQASSGCASVDLGAASFELAADLTIYTTAASQAHGTRPLTAVSVDAAPRKLSILSVAGALNLNKGIKGGVFSLITGGVITIGIGSDFVGTAHGGTVALNGYGVVRHPAKAGG
ncbi:cutinase family protein [Frigoribacterium sp. CFBP 13707]|uniref:cutinase family protein n=1 Tax=Frigoribacterium sp. CFBP 13707 TaxID=2775313 RepID=UPI00177F8A6D|nr:cutinase family protein [Frigoribacterium sp. CFBP 13707]MBD8726496.1 cutinase family protein [Frigoribacterium sp. CFBP 13707]